MKSYEKNSLFGLVLDDGLHLILLAFCKLSQGLQPLSRHILPFT